VAATLESRVSIVFRSITTQVDFDPDRAIVLSVLLYLSTSCPNLNSFELIEKGSQSFQVNQI